MHLLKSHRFLLTATSFISVRHEKSKPVERRSPWDHRTRCEVVDGNDEPLLIHFLSYIVVLSILAEYSSTRETI